MTKPIYKSFLAGALLMAVSATASFGQYYPQPSYQNQGSVAPQLDNLVAPVALYPDSLLSQVLVACTYPQQLADASQWLSQSGYLQGEQRLQAAQQQNWDPSVQALVAFPDVLQRLTQDPQWTSELGNAFLNNQAAVMNAVQEMRERAQQSGRLQSTPQQTVNIENYGGERAIEIASANPEVLYVPSYDPAYIWGAPSYGYYPSLSYPSWGFGFGSGISLGGFFGGYRGSYGGYGNRYGGWGWGSNWRDRRVTVNNDFFYRNRFNGYQDGRYSSGSNIWRHDNNRGNAFAAGYSRGYGNQQQSFNGNYRQQGFRSNQQVTPQQQYSQPRSFGQNRQQRSFEQNPQPSAVRQAPQQQAPQQQNFRPRSFDQSQQQLTQPRSFQQTPQQFTQSRSFQQAPQQQFSRPARSEAQQQRFEQRNSSRNDGAGVQRSDQQQNFGRNHR
jgi:hypothetical protein